MLFKSFIKKPSNLKTSLHTLTVFKFQVIGMIKVGAIKKLVWNFKSGGDKTAFQKFFFYGEHMSQIIRNNMIKDQEKALLIPNIEY